jgi:hypothetical protein
LLFFQVFFNQNIKFTIKSKKIVKKGMKRIVNTLIHSIFRLRDAMILTFFVLTVFSLIGIQLYKGVLRSKCVQSPPINASDIEYNEFIYDNGTSFLMKNLKFFKNIYF